MKRNPIICLLVVGLMIVTLTGQAAAAFRMACEGTTSCCCLTAPPTHSMPADITPMASGCCDTPFSHPCDLAGPASTSTAPFLPVENNAASDVSATFMIAASAAVDAINCGSFNRMSIRPPLLAGPPIYLLTQSFLC
ncbi:MAG: hypothetical protein U9Q05_13005 [Thermodesulfobacteriota bacterium]|nr:hypothetical protein [Thermodesulfobacteriota bacterium]